LSDGNNSFIELLGNSHEMRKHEFAVGKHP
jgi:hypothetical protein